MAIRSFLLLCVVGAVFAEKDSRYYPPGRSNPNVNDRYYWKNSLNVMQDLDQFESLYVEYSGCVWSRYGFGDGCDDVGAANQDDDEQSNIAYWYLGSTMCFRANAAYSLYGVLHGDEDLGCHKKRYIKSFFSVWAPNPSQARSGWKQRVLVPSVKRGINDTFDFWPKMIATIFRMMTSGRSLTSSPPTSTTR
jgi:hypothetical protein